TRAHRRPRSTRSRQSKTAWVLLFPVRAAAAGKLFVPGCVTSPCRTPRSQKRSVFRGVHKPGNRGNQSPLSCAALMPASTVGMLRRTAFQQSPGGVMAVTAREVERDHHLTTGLGARLACRRGSLRGNTAGVAPGYVQGNLAVLPADLAADFLRFC